MRGAANPVLVEIHRGEVVESRHRGAVAVVDASGRQVAAWGEVRRPVLPRSCVKPIQALPLLESGALAAFGLGDEELALASASHSGEPRHVERVRAWLNRIGLSEADLECGGVPSALYNNCSGKHAGFLTVARHLGMNPRGYVRPDHPVQRLVTEALERLTGIVGAPFAVDGCSIPTFAFPLNALALAMARLPPSPVVDAMIAHPGLVAGEGRLDTVVMEAVPRLAVKGGAEGCHAAIIPGQGLGIMLKIDDGAGRAADVAILAVLDRLGLFTPAERAALADRMSPPVMNAAGKVVGRIYAPRW